MIKKLLTAAAAALVAVSVTACSRSQPGPAPEEQSKPAQSTARQEDGGSVKFKDAAPDFLADAPEPDVLSDVVFRSFDPAAVITEPDRQAVKGFDCVGFFNNMCYIFKENDNFGIVSLAGKVLFEPEGITKIEAVSPELISVTKKDGQTRLYRVSFDAVTPVQAKKFDISRITFEPAVQTSDDSEDSGSEIEEEIKDVPADDSDSDKDKKDTGTDNGFILRIDGRDLKNDVWKEWDSFEEVSLDGLKTEADEGEQKTEAVFLAENSRGRFYLLFDKYCNLTVSRAELGFAELKIGELYGGYYITDPEAYRDLETLVSAFGDENGSPGLPSGDSGSDYIRLVFGRNDDPDRAVYTISPEGYCFTEVSQDENIGRYFRKMSPETFSDLVVWVEKKLGSTGA
ncbi:MAG: hypothetical protein K6B74_10715 [Ruminococcus sp.]|nr:hypothetical protein [Ruminococcus sp.]